MKIGNLSVTLHRTVRVADGRQPANLPPSLGHMQPYHVSEYKDKCPSTWEESGLFVALHDVEALWMSFQPTHPVALLVGAGGINALAGEKLGTKLEKDNYLVAPPQPWLDGWKSPDGCVYQFVATPHLKGEGKTVGEQLIGVESLTGGIGLAVFDSKEPLKKFTTPPEMWGSGVYEDTTKYSLKTKSFGAVGQSDYYASASISVTDTSSRSTDFLEMGVGKGGKIIQKIYPDPHGLEVWKESPTATLAIYLVDAKTFSEITGLPMTPSPVSQEDYFGKWFGLEDQTLGDVSGSEKFVGLASVFVGDLTNMEKK